MADYHVLPLLRKADEPTTRRAYPRINYWRGLAITAMVMLPWLAIAAGIYISLSDGYDTGGTLNPARP